MCPQVFKLQSHSAVFLIDYLVLIENPVVANRWQFVTTASWISGYFSLCLFASFVQTQAFGLFILKVF